MAAICVRNIGDSQWGTIACTRVVRPIKSKNEHILETQGLYLGLQCIRSFVHYSTTDNSIILRDILSNKELKKINAAEDIYFIKISADKRTLMFLTTKGLDYARQIHLFDLISGQERIVKTFKGDVSIDFTDRYVITTKNYSGLTEFWQYSDANKVAMINQIFT